jgi:hypothetical protein
MMPFKIFNLQLPKPDKRVNASLTIPYLITEKPKSCRKNGQLLRQETVFFAAYSAGDERVTKTKIARGGSLKTAPLQTRVNQLP